MEARGRRNRANPTLVLVLTAASTLLLPLTARADGSAEDKAAAEALFQRGKQLMAEGKFGEACPKLANSQQLDPGVGTLLNLADCYEKNGQIASAWATYKEAVSGAKAAGQSERESAARARAVALEPRLPQLVIRVPAGASSGVTQVKRDGSVVVEGVYGIPLPVDPGDHVIEASGTKHKKWSQHVTAVEAKSITVTVPTLEPEQAEPAPAPLASSPPAAAPPVVTPATVASPPATAPAPAADTAPSPAPASGDGQRVAGLVVGGVGIVGVIAGSAVGLAAKSKYDGAVCHDGNLCPQPGFDDRKSAISMGTTATVLFGVGAAALVGGVVLWVTSPSSAHATTLGVAPVVGREQAGLSLRGSWQ